MPRVPEGHAVAEAGLDRRVELDVLASGEFDHSVILKAGDGVGGVGSSASSASTSSRPCLATPNTTAGSAGFTAAAEPPSTEWRLAMATHNLLKFHKHQLAGLAA
jgi:hypothetical protein